MPVRQHALTVVLPVRAALRSTVASSLEKIEREVIRALERVESLHFARFVVIGGPDKPCLAFESNHDGDQRAHLEELTKALAPFEDVLFDSWEGYLKGSPIAFITENARPAATYYLGHPGLSVRQIRNDDLVRQRLDVLLDELHAKTDCSAGKGASAIRDQLLRELAADGFVLGAVDRGLPAQPMATIQMAGVVAAVGMLALGFIPAAFLVERREEETEGARVLVTEGDTRLDAIIAHEDAVSQNGLTHHVPMRPGVFRRSALRIVLWFLEHARKKVAYEGELGGISSIHFARWVFLDDDTVLFFSNYDGSWEAYLGEFVDKAHHWLTAVWTNTRWFPKTRGLIGDGAAKEADFKQWTRTFQVKNQIWYSAYPYLTVSDVLRNAKIREGAAGTMTDEEACAWLALL